MKCEAHQNTMLPVAGEPGRFACMSGCTASVAPPAPPVHKKPSRWAGAPTKPVQHVLEGRAMKILALDPATKFGWAHSDGPGGTWDLSVRRDESAGMRLIRLRGKLNEVQGSGKIGLVVFESARHAAPGMQGALITQTEFQGVIKVWCEDERIQYRGYSPSELKKFATGKGNAGKASMMEEAKKRWPHIHIVDDNHADALFLLELARRDYD